MQTLAVQLDTVIYFHSCSISGGLHTQKLRPSLQRTIESSCKTWWIRPQYSYACFTYCREFCIFDFCHPGSFNLIPPIPLETWSNARREQGLKPFNFDLMTLFFPWCDICRGRWVWYEDSVSFTYVIIVIIICRPIVFFQTFLFVFTSACLNFSIIKLESSNATSRSPYRPISTSPAIRRP